MKLARIFGDYLVFQRRAPILLWGEAEAAEHILVRLNGELLCEADIPKGRFSLTLPAQEALMDVTLEVGSQTLCHVDIGEVWVAGGQSNMEFKLQYADIGESVIAGANDPHLRCYTVGQYSFPREREMGYKAWNPWDRWLPFTKENAPGMTAVGVHFAQALRKDGIPVGILSCNWGGTSASAWTRREALEKNPEICCYVTEFDERVAAMDLERYYAVKNIIRPAMASPASRKMTDVIMKNTFHPGEMEKMLTAGQSGKPSSQDGGGLPKLTMEEIMAVGPGDPNEPGALYDNMLREILGYSIRGVIWYQGETDESHPQIYDRLFATMVSCWRQGWLVKNPAQTRIPFLFVQLAPFGTWRGDFGDKYPILRACQARAAQRIPDCYMTSISDIGNVYDIHPKVKQPVGERLAILAERYVYGKNIQADPPVGIAGLHDGDTVTISFCNGEGLHIVPGDFCTYNGFPTDSIAEELLPPVLGGVNGLELLADGEPVSDGVCQAEDGVLSVTSPKLTEAKRIEVRFAWTAFYQVNIFNAAGLPAEPFQLIIE